MTDRGSGERQSAKSCKELHINPVAVDGVGNNVKVKVGIGVPEDPGERVFRSVPLC